MELIPGSETSTQFRRRGYTQKTMSHIYITKIREIEVKCPDFLNCSSQLIAYIRLKDILSNYE
jgi:hypothetical protein